jgi:hypothetical protein
MRAMTVLVIIVAISVAGILLGGCRSQSLAACQAENTRLAKEAFDLQAKLADEKEDMENAGNVMGNVFLDLDAKEKQIAALEKENADLKKQIEKLSTTEDSSKRMVQGVAELKKMQREAAAKLKEQQAADANKPQ